MSILKQVIDQDHSSLEKAATAYAYSCIAVYDATISTWQTKYAHNLVRPVTYIQSVLGHTTWMPLLTTPAHPEYSSAHACLSASFASALSTINGYTFSFTDHTYDYFGYPAGSFSSFQAMGDDARNSILYAGIHYQPSINVGFIQGRKVAHNIRHHLHLRFF